MRLLWLKLLLLSTFAFWASGTAKFVHEAIEHGGRSHAIDADGCDDDDDDATPAAVVATAAAPAGHDQPIHHGHPCPVCQMLAAMAVDRPHVAVIPAPSAELVATLVVADWCTPLVRPAFIRLTTGPPIV